MYRNEDEHRGIQAAVALPQAVSGGGNGRGNGAGNGTGPTARTGPDLGPLLVGLQLTDSAFPSGFYTLSHSLEGFAHAGAVDSGSLPSLLRDLLLHGVGPADATALALAHRATAEGDLDAVAGVDAHLYATKLGREMRQASTRTGRQLLDLAAEVFDRPPITAYFDRVRRHGAPGTQAVAAGVIYAATGVPVRQAVACDLFAFCASFAGAALRLRLTDHRRAQSLLRGAAPVIERVAEEALRRELADVGATVFASDVMSGRHERAEARLFAS
ncbi:urease accessory protein UreF [Streptomyces sp. NBC_01237]|uniref:urease accessory protein UreF n=1 Tax=Streptomyces sp. NBC_01237 TaxID=2903790 RepID=UPI002DD98E58|nr:urease accessory UreF family protein [Streptomyces sp. NBC_01237]WRZ78214.1 urease accessory protein [Streptomyces sp. NBC_01237]